MRQTSPQNAVIVPPYSLFQNGPEKIQKRGSRGFSRNKRPSLNTSSNFSRQNQKRCFCQIPLYMAFIMQILVIIAAFAAVIVILSEQQRSEFKDALYKQLVLQQERAVEGIANPLLERQNAFSFIVQQYLETPGGYGSPREDDEFSDMLRWVNHFYILPKSDPFVLSVSMANQSTTRYPAYPNLATYTAWFVQNGLIAYATNETVYACITLLPMVDASSCPPLDDRNPFMSVINTAVEWGDPLGFRGKDLWGPPSYLNNTIDIAHYMTFTHTPHPEVRPIQAITISFVLSHIDEIMSTAVVKPTSRNAVFYQYYKYETDLTEYFLVGGIFDFPPMSSLEDPTIFQSRIWRGGETPDERLNAAFEWAKNTNVNQTGGDATEIEVGGERFVATAARAFDAATEFDFLLVQYTPRREFFGVSDQARLVGIMIGVAGALLVLISCVLIWLAIYRPLQRLHSQMALAAEMRNDEVVAEDGRVNLKEIRDLRNAFLQMNRKLLKARPFLPQSLLAPDVEDGGDDVSVAAAVVEEELPQIFVTERVVGSDASDAASSKYVVKSGAESADQANSQTDVIKRSIGKKLEFRYVGVLSVNVKGFHETTGVAQPHEVSRWQTALTALVGEAAAEERGILDYFQGDHFAVSFNAARACTDPSRCGARTAVKVWDRFRAHAELASRFPGGVAMGLSAGRAAVGNQGTDTMKRLATVGQPYTEAARLQDAMSRRVLGGRLPEVGGRCLILGRLVQDVSSNMLCQVVGGLEAAHVLPSGCAGKDAIRRLQVFAASHNESACAVSMREQALATTNPHANASVSTNSRRGRSASAVAYPTPTSSATPGLPARTSVIVAVVVAVADSKADEWYYRLDQWVPRNPHNQNNAAICRLWFEGVKAEVPSEVAALARTTTGPSVSFAIGRSKGPLSVVVATTPRSEAAKHEYDPNAPRAPAAVSPQISSNNNLDDAPNSFPSAYSSSEGEPSAARTGIRRLRQHPMASALKGEVDAETSTSHDCTDTANDGAARVAASSHVLTTDGASDIGIEMTPKPVSPTFVLGPVPTTFRNADSDDNAASRSSSQHIARPKRSAVASGGSGDESFRSGGRQKSLVGEANAPSIVKKQEGSTPSKTPSSLWQAYVSAAMALPTPDDAIGQLLLKDNWQ